MLFFFFFFWKCTANVTTSVQRKWISEEEVLLRVAYLNASDSLLFVMIYSRLSVIEIEGCKALNGLIHIPQVQEQMRDWGNDFIGFAVKIGLLSFVKWFCQVKAVNLVPLISLLQKCLECKWTLNELAAAACQWANISIQSFQNIHPWKLRQ